MAERIESVTAKRSQIMLKCQPQNLNLSVPNIKKHLTKIIKNLHIVRQAKASHKSSHLLLLIVR
nr:MAG TPA: hypothetical protein [Caudoviricetes sp.]